MNLSGAHFYYVLWKWPKREDGVYAVKLCAVYKEVRRYYGKQYNINLKLSQDDFDVIIHGHPRSEEKQKIKAKLERMKQHAEAVLDRMDPFVFDFDEFERLLFKREKGGSIAVATALLNYRDKVKASGTKELYALTSRLVEKYYPGATFSKVDVKFLESFERFMKRQDLSVSSIGIHTRNIRTVYNQAIRDKVAHIERYPFGRGKYIPPKATQAKKLTDLAVVKKIYQFSSDDSKLQFARDIYIFSFFCGGANSKDIFLLRNQNIQHESIEFRRTKTGGKFLVSIPLIPVLSDIVTRNRNGEYLFDVMQPNMKESSIQDKAKKVRKRINRSLRNLTGVGITAHEARHSFSTYANSIGMPEPMISYFMGHSSGSITRGYMSFPIADKRKWLQELEDYLK